MNLMLRTSLIFFQQVFQHGVLFLLFFFLLSTQTFFCSKVTWVRVFIYVSRDQLRRAKPSRSIDFFDTNILPKFFPILLYALKKETTLLNISPYYQLYTFCVIKIQLLFFLLFRDNSSLFTRSKFKHLNHSIKLCQCHTYISEGNFVSSNEVGVFIVNNFYRFY